MLYFLFHPSLLMEYMLCIPLAWTAYILYRHVAGGRGVGGRVGVGGVHLALTSYSARGGGEGGERCRQICRQKISVISLLSVTQPAANVTYQVEVW